jgi:hypothetical protein
MSHQSIYLSPSHHDSQVLSTRGFYSMLLLEICDEVLDLVVANIYTRKDLCSVALTCRALYKLARSHIPRRVSFRIPSERYKLFQRTLHSSLGYGHGVRRLVVQYDPSNFKYVAPMQDVWSLLERCPNVQCLKFLPTTTDGLFKAAGFPLRRLYVRKFKIFELPRREIGEFSSTLRKLTFEE